MRIAWKPCIAELVGTFAVVFFGAGAACADALTGGRMGALGVATASGLALAIAMAATLRLSGGHLNPAVTGAFVASGRMRLEDAWPYVVAQLAGASLAAWVLRIIYAEGVWRKVRLGAPAMGAGLGEGAGIFIEALLTFLLVFVFYATILEPGGPAIGGAGVGLILLAGILVAGPLSGAMMNPARAFGPALLAGVWKGHVVWWIGPLLGACAAALLYDRVLKR